MKSIADTLAELQRKSKQRSAPKQVEAKTPSTNLPKVRTGSVAAPNALFRSALFPALNNQTREYLRDVTLFSVAGLDIQFRGEQFDQTDLDVYLGILHIANSVELGAVIEFTAYSFLKMIKRGTDDKSYAWLYSSISRLQSSTVIIKDHKNIYRGSLIDAILKTENSSVYRIKLNPDYAVLFSRGLWSAIDMVQRQAIGRNQTAKSLHAYYSTHTNPSPHKIETLAKIAGLNNKNKYMIPVTIIKAHDILCSETVDFLESYTVDDGKISTVIKDK